VTASAGDPVAPFRAGTTGPTYAAARAAYGEAWGVPPVEIGVGGSIGFLAPFARAFPEAEVLITGVEDPDTRAHSPDESLHLGEFARACLAEALLLRALGG
jgi:cysteinylglycine-S-conjugate dipeptidase